MSSIEVRPFRRSDLDQVTQLVNIHAAAVIPGLSAPGSTVLARIDGQHGQHSAEPAAGARVALVAEQQNRVAAAALLLRHIPRDEAGAVAGAAGEICWFLFRPQAPAGNPYWLDATEAADALMSACLAQLGRWGPARQQAGGDLLPVRGVCGVPEQWPHVRTIYERAGFAHTGHTDIVSMARVEDLPRPAGPPIARLVVRRSLGPHGTRLAAMLGEDLIGSADIRILGETGAGISREEEQVPWSRWADMGSLQVASQYRRQGIATWLLGEAAGWLRLAQIDRLLGGSWLEGRDSAGQACADGRPFLTAAGFLELTRTMRGWDREPQET
ncbi:MAG: GNAT family N-acetyltransferase [Streptosporangiaceae bacterium]